MRKVVKTAIARVLPTSPKSKKKYTNKSTKKSAHAKGNKTRTKSFVNSSITTNVSIVPVPIAEKYILQKRSLAKRLGELHPSITLDMDNVEGFFKHWGNKLTECENEEDVTLIRNEFFDDKNGIQWVHVGEHKVNEFSLLGGVLPEPRKAFLRLEIFGNSWFYIKESRMIENAERPFGLFAGKTFKKGEIIGVYMGGYDKNLRTESDEDSDSEDDENFQGDVSNLYGFQNMNPTVGPPKIYMGVHFINDAKLITLQEDITQSRKPGSKSRSFNVKLNEDYTLEVTTKFIKKGHELLMKYFKKPVYEQITRVSHNNKMKKFSKK